MALRRYQRFLYHKPHTCLYCGRFYAHTGKYLDHLKRHRKQIRPHWYTLHELHTDNEPYKCPSCHQILASIIAKALNQYSLEDFARTCGNCSKRWEFCLKKPVGVTQLSHAFLQIRPQPNMATHTSSKKMHSDNDKGHIDAEKTHSDAEKRHMENETMHTYSKKGACTDNVKKHVEKNQIHNKKTKVDISSALKTFNCSICHKAFSRQGAIKRHRLVHSNERPHICQHCKRGFKLATHLKQHLRTHTNEKPFECHICYKRFAQSSTRNSHILRHSETPVCINKMLFKCHICDICFYQRSALNDHLETHTEIEKTQYYNEGRTHICPHCNKGFKDNEALNRHLRLKSREISSINKRRKVFKCWICNETFPQLKELTHHLDTHSVNEKEQYFKDKVHICVHCQRGFKRPSHVKQHIATCHTHEKPN